MKKNLKKIETSVNSKKIEDNRAEIRYLGFVVDPDASPDKAVSHALVNLKGYRDKWYIIELSEDRYPPKFKDSVGRYFRIVFSLAVQTWLSYSERGKLEKNQVLLQRDDPEYAKIATYLRDQDRVDKSKGVSSNFPKLRRAIHGSLFWPSGEKKKKGSLDVIWKDKAKPDIIFFWNPQEFHLYVPGMQECKPFEPIDIKDFVPQNKEINPPNLRYVAETILHTDFGYSWQDLYREALINSIKLKSFVELTAYCPSISDNTNKQENNHSFFPEFTQYQQKSEIINTSEVFSTDRKILLLGPSGSGKSTTLHYLAWMLALGKQKINGLKALPILVPLKYFGNTTINNSILPDMPQYIAAWVCQTMRDSLSTADLERCTLFTGQKQQSFSREDMLGKFYDEIVGIISNNKSEISNIVFLLDGYNEIPENFAWKAQEDIQHLSAKTAIIITARSQNICGIFPQLKTLNLNELSDELIITYLSQHFQDRAEEYFSSHISQDKKVLSLARIPFFLYLIVEQLKEVSETKLTSNRALLIQKYIYSSIISKHKEGISPPAHVKDDMVYDVLPLVAKWRINYRISKGDIDYSPDFRHTPEYHRLENTHYPVYAVLDIAERYGLLKQSGLLYESTEHQLDPDFLHDYIRDYFAAHYLLQYHGLSKIPDLYNILEYNEWDNAICMYFELQADRHIFDKDLENITKIDPLLAARCLYSSQLTTKIDAQNTLSRFSLERMEEMCSYYAFGTSYDIHNAWSLLLSYEDPDNLLKLYRHLFSSLPLRGAIVSALVLALGEKVMPYLIEMEKAFNFPYNFQAFIGMQEIGTTEAWERLCAKYIEIERSDNLDIDEFEKFAIEIFEDLLKSDRFNPPLNKIIKLVKKARAILIDTCNSYIIDKVIDLIIFPIRRWGHNRINELIKLEKSGDKNISKIATEVLAGLHYVPAIKKLKVDLSEKFISTPPPQLLKDIYTLCHINDQEIELLLWELFENNLSDGKNSVLLQFIPELLSFKTNPSVLERIIIKVLYSESFLAALSLKSFISIVPQLVLKAVRFIKSNTKIIMNSSLWYRLMVARGGCGDTDVSINIINILPRIEKIQWISKKIESRDRLGTHIIKEGIKHGYTEITFNAIKKLGLIQAKHELFKISNTCQDVFIEDNALQTFIYLRILEVSTPSQAQYIASLIHATCMEKRDLKRYYRYLTACCNSWPNYAIYYFISSLHDLIEVNIEKEDNNTLLLYELLSLLRDGLGRRFLNIFHGWPIFPCDYGIMCKSCGKEAPDVQFAILLPGKYALCERCLLSKCFLVKEENQLDHNIHNDRILLCNYCDISSSNSKYIDIDGIILCVECLKQAMKRIKLFKLIVQSRSAKDIEEGLQSKHPFHIIASLDALSESSDTQTQKAMRLAIRTLGIGDNSPLWQTVRQIAYETLIVIGDKAIKYCADAINSPNWRIKANIALIMGRFLTSSKAKEILFKLSRDTDNKVREWVIDALVDEDDDSARMILSYLSEDIDSKVAQKASKAINFNE